MKVSLKWLSDYVNLDGVNIKEFCDAMTMSGSKVETYEIAGDSFKRVVTGKVLKINKHPNAENLVICKVNVTEKYGSILQIITGAKNLKIDDVVPVALDGATLPGDVKIGNSSLRGAKSEGMMCSLEELGVKSRDIGEKETSDGIFVFKKETKIGEDVHEYLGQRDYVIDFEITPNRPDCLSVIGLGREAAATLKRNIVLKEPEYVSFRDESKTNLHLNVENIALCPYYSARVIENVSIGESPDFIKLRLNLMGVKSINNVVDITNYVMLEYGQPLHAFDCNEINGRSINVRLANEGEKLVILDGTELVLTSSDLVIADSSKPIALAGVMGGLSSGIKNSTTTIVLESANFNPITVRKSSKRHNIRTEASARYERGLPKENCVLAMNRACYLLKRYCGCNTASRIYEVGSNKSEKTEIEFVPEFVNKFLNLNLNINEMKEILSRLEFKIEKGKVLVPFFRSDIKNMYDIAEEIARFYGYNNITSTTLSGTHFSKTSDYSLFKEKVCSTMQGLGVTEVLTSPFESPDFYERMLLNKSDYDNEVVKISNPLGLETSLMRPLLESSLLKVLKNNFSHKNTEVKCFEIAKKYRLKVATSEPQEIEELIAGFYGKNMNFFYVKGVVLELFRKLSIPNIDFISECECPFLHPGICAKIFLENETHIGYISKVHPLVSQNYEIPDNTFLLNLDVDKLFNCRNKCVTYKNVPVYPAIERDISVVCNENLNVAFFESIIKNNAGKNLEKVEVFDVYRGPQVPKNKKSLSFKLTFRNIERTLTEKEVNESMNKVFDCLEKSGGIIRNF